MQADTFRKIFRELDEQCHRRAEVYPQRDKVYRDLYKKIEHFSEWLQAQKSSNWRPNRELIQKAKTLVPIFIGGFYKSGTTFVLNLLDGHPEISALPGDAKLLRAFTQANTPPRQKRDAELLRSWIWRLVSPTGLPPFWLFGTSPGPYLEFVHYLEYWLKQLPNSVSDRMNAVARAFYCANPNRSEGARYWIDKTPTQECYANELLTMYPKARFLHILRNPFATISAIKKIGPEGGQEAHLVNLINGLGISMRHARENSERWGEDRYIVLHYESILNNPDEILNCLASKLNISFFETLTRPTVNNMPSTSNSAYRENRWQGCIYKHSLNQWRKNLCFREIEHISDALFDEAAACGYHLDEPRPRGFRSIWLGAMRSATRIKQSVRYRLKTVIKKASEVDILTFRKDGHDD